MDSLNNVQSVEFSKGNQKWFEIVDSKQLRGKSKGNSFHFEITGIQNSQVCIYRVSAYS